jgi:molybdopterin-guanine dinucleotide biosynthesis protein A
MAQSLNKDISTWAWSEELDTDVEGADFDYQAAEAGTGEMSNAALSQGPTPPSPPPVMGPKPVSAFDQEFWDPKMHGDSFGGDKRTRDMGTQTERAYFLEAKELAGMVKQKPKPLENIEDGINRYRALTQKLCLVTPGCAPVKKARIVAEMSAIALSHGDEEEFAEWKDKMHLAVLTQMQDIVKDWSAEKKDQLQKEMDNVDIKRAVVINLEDEILEKEDSVRTLKRECKDLEEEIQSIPRPSVVRKLNL